MHENIIAYDDDDDELATYEAHQPGSCTYNTLWSV